MKNKKEEIEKPIILQLEETRIEMVNLINKSDLPYFIVIPMLEDLLRQLRELNQKQYEEERRNYEEQLKEMEEKNVQKKNK